MHMHNITGIFNPVSGDDDKKEKVSLYSLCHLLAKKGSEDTCTVIKNARSVIHNLCAVHLHACM